MQRDDRGGLRLRDNPFYVLELRPDATRAAIERQGSKLLGMLELSLKSARSYRTPVGPGERTADKVRRAMAELRDPSRRLEHELWARLDPGKMTDPARLDDVDDATRESGEDARAEAPWEGALIALGWRARPPAPAAPTGDAAPSATRGEGDAASRDDVDGAP
jgi:hypothetical protein